MFSSLLYRLLTLVRDDAVDRIGLSARHPLLRFGRDLNDLQAFCALDDGVIWGSLSQLIDSDDKCLSELAARLLERKLYKVIDVTALLAARLSNIESEGERDDTRQRAEAVIRERLRESGLLEDQETAPNAISDVIRRDPYKQNQGDEAALEMIYAIDQTAELMELSKLSRVVAALRPFEAFRIYHRKEDNATKDKLKTIIEGGVNA